MTYKTEPNVSRFPSTAPHNSPLAAWLIVQAYWERKLRPAEQLERKKRGRASDHDKLEFFREQRDELAEGEEPIEKQFATLYDAIAVAASSFLNINNRFHAYDLLSDCAAILDKAMNDENLRVEALVFTLAIRDAEMHKRLRNHKVAPLIPPVTVAT